MRQDLHIRTGRKGHKPCKEEMLSILFHKIWKESKIA
jgi:hypothetical protein